MDYPDYRDENGKVWTKDDMQAAPWSSDDYKQMLLDKKAERSGWSRYEQPDPYSEN